MTKFFINRFRYVPNPKGGDPVKKWQTFTCKTNLLPDHKLVKMEQR